MSSNRARLRVALVHHDLHPSTVDAAKGFLSAGHEPEVIGCHRSRSCRTVVDGVPVVRCRRLPEAPLRWRGFVGPLTHLPGVLTTLVRGGYDIVYAWSSVDTTAALVWSRLTGRPTVFAPAEAPARERLADRRLRLWTIVRALEHSDAVIAPSVEVRQALDRWLAVDAPVVEPLDAPGHERLYAELRAGRS